MPAEAGMHDTPGWSLHRLARLASAAMTMARGLHSDA